jgi:hypothetical protein
MTHLQVRAARLVFFAIPLSLVACGGGDMASRTGAYAPNCELGYPNCAPIAAALTGAAETASSRAVPEPVKEPLRPGLNNDNS